MIFHNRSRREGAALLCLWIACQFLGTVLGADRPNILWITCEDINPQLGCYGDAYARTPELDRFAARALRYRNCWSTAPVCAPARTALITGVYPTSTGAEHMRSLVAMPGWMKMFPQFLRAQGYYCSNNSKEDYNLIKPTGVWDESSRRAHWRNRSSGQPFFAVFNLEISHESQIRTRPHTLEHDPARAPVPAYHPDTPEVRHDWAQYYDKITDMDARFGQRLKELEADGLLENTIVFFFGDNGGGMPRSKRWPYNSGLRVPLIVFVPEKYLALAPADYRPGAETERLVGFVDFAPTLVSLLGLQAPDWMQGHAFMGPRSAPPQPYLFGFRGRMDERYDLVRSVRNSRYLYARNFLPHLIYGQFIDYQFQTPTTRVWKSLYDEGKLRPPQTCFWERKPFEELYDLESDPDEVRNLAESPAHRAVLAELRQALREHIRTVRDVGLLPEAEFHRRAEGSTPYEMGHDPRLYPLDRVLAMAELASSSRSDSGAELRPGLRDPDAGVRYWAATGLFIRGQAAVAASLAELREALKDGSPSVRIAAAWALGKYAGKDDVDPALAALIGLAAPDRNGVYAAVQALNAIEGLGEKARPLLAAVKSLPLKDPKADDRVNPFVRALVPQIVRQLEPPPAGSAAGQGGRTR